MTQEGVEAMGAFVSILQNIVNNSVDKDNSNVDVVISRYLLDHVYPPLEDLDIEGLAEACFTSVSTVSRFCRKTGCNSFGEMKANYLGIHHIGEELFLDNESNLVFDSVHDNQTLNNYIELVSDALLDFGEQIDFAEIEELCKNIHDSQDIIIFGTMISGAFVYNFQNMLLSIGKRVSYHPTHQLQIESLKHVTDKTLIIVASTDGNFIQKRDQLVMDMHNSPARKVLITQNITLKRRYSFDKVIQLGNYKHPKVGRYKLQLFFEVLANKYYQLYGFK